MPRVTVVGSYIVALVMDTDRFPTEGETVTGKNFHTTFGGKGSNVAVCAARLGAESHFIGKLGRDSFGADFVAMLDREGVKSDGVLYSASLNTGVGFILLKPDGTNLIAIDAGANGDLNASDLLQRQEIIRDSQVIVSPLEIPLTTALAAAALAQANGVKAILNPAPAADLRGQDLKSIFALTPNETEARVCLGLSPRAEIDERDLALALLALGPEHVMLTRGRRGVLWASRNGVEMIPALNVKVVDTVGAGDAFNAGLAVALSEGREVIDAVRLGVVTASLSTEKRETIPSYPYRKEVDSRMKGLV
jgi:ribokinase